MDKLEKLKEEIKDETYLSEYMDLKKASLDELVLEAEKKKPLAYYTNSTHNVYLTPIKEDLGESHVYNRQLKLAH